MSLWADTKDPRIKKRNGVYWARFMKQNKRVEMSLATKSFEVAKRLVEDAEAKILVGRSWKRERQMFSDAWVEFLLDKKAGNKVRPAREKTMQEYAGFGDRYYLPYFGDMRLSDINEESWGGFIAWVKRERGDILFFNIRKYFMGFLTWARRHEKILTPPYLLDPDAKANQEREEFTPGKAYTKVELRRLRAASSKRGRFHLVMLMSQYMGMRPSEITQLKRERVDIENGVIALKKADTKTNSARMVPIHPAVRPRLVAELLASRDSDYLFPGVNDRTGPVDRTGFKKVWREILEAANVEGRMYDLRHTFITHAIGGGVSPTVVAVITGTSLRVIEKYYLHLGPNELNKAIKAFQL